MSPATHTPTTTHTPCHACSPATHAPHACPLPCMPPAMHAPCMHALPAMHTPCHAHPLPHMPSPATHAPLRTDRHLRAVIKLELLEKCGVLITWTWRRRVCRGCWTLDTFVLKARLVQRISCIGAHLLRHMILGTGTAPVSNIITNYCGTGHYLEKLLNWVQCRQILQRKLSVLQ